MYDLICSGPYSYCYSLETELFHYRRLFVPSPFILAWSSSLDSTPRQPHRELLYHSSTLATLFSLCFFNIYFFPSWHGHALTISDRFHMSLLTSVVISNDYFDFQRCIVSIRPPQNPDNYLRRTNTTIPQDIGHRRPVYIILRAWITHMFGVL